MARPKSEFLSAFGTAWQIMKELGDAVQALLNAEPDGALRLVLTDKALLDRVAVQFVDAWRVVQFAVQATNDAKSAFRTALIITVNPALTLAQTIAEGKFNWKNDLLMSLNWSDWTHCVPLPTVETATEISLFHFDKAMSTNQALAALDAADFRPATLLELLKFGAMNKKIQWGFPIVALGSVWKRLALYIYEYEDSLSCDLDMRSYDSGWVGWGKEVRFAAVRKSAKSATGEAQAAPASTAV